MAKHLMTILTLVGLSLGGVMAQDSAGDWVVSYFNSTDLSGDVAASQAVNRIDFDFSATDGPPPPSGVNEENFSLRAEANINFAVGTYRFRLGSDDGARLAIDNEMALDRFVPRSYTEDTVDVFIPAGVRNVRVEYFQVGGDGRLTLSWERISEQNLGASEPTPAAPPPPEPTAPPAATLTTGQVVSVEGLSVRSGPFLGASRLDIIAPGTEYPVFAQNTAEGLYIWYLIEVQDVIRVADDTTGEIIEQPTGEPIRGWVSGRYFVTDAPANQIPPAQTVFETLTNPTRTTVQGVLRSNMRLRAGASYRTPTLAILDWGAEVEIVGRTIQADRNHWFQVIYEDQVGWLYAPFITINGDINVVPTY
jgi:hypothetical protein